MVIKIDSPYKILINKEVLDSTRTYKILSSDYLAHGGDDMTFFLDPIKYENVGIKLRDAIIKYFEEEEKKGRSINSKIEGRIINE